VTLLCELTTNSWPAFSRFFAMGLPMIPSPMNPILIDIPSSWWSANSGAFPYNGQPVSTRWDRTDRPADRADHQSASSYRWRMFVVSVCRQQLHWEYSVEMLLSCQPLETGGPVVTMDAASPTAHGESITDRGGVREVKSAARTVELLELLAARRNQPARLRELSEALNAPRSSIYALLRTLVDRGWVRTDATGTLYSIGIQALLAGTTYLDVDPLLRIVQPQITDLSTQLNETIHYGRLRRTDIVYLATHESTQYIRPYSRVGRRLPAFSTSLGKSLLALRLGEDGLGDNGPDGLAAHLPTTLTPLTVHTLVDPDALIADLRATTKRGYAIDREENLLGVTCFAMAMRLGGTSSDAISVSVPLERLGDREPEIVEALRKTKNSIERMAPVSYAGDHF
jgi:DNA-binding IclR family transcriptional regulator